MKSRKQVWIAALCLFSALAIAVVFTSRMNSVQAGKRTSQISESALSQITIPRCRRVHPHAAQPGTSK